jgi:hypothetical protein
LKYSFGCGSAATLALAAALLVPSARALQFVFTDITPGNTGPYFLVDDGLFAIEAAIDIFSAGEHLGDGWPLSHFAPDAASPMRPVIGADHEHAATARDLIDAIGWDPADPTSESETYVLLLAALSVMGFVATRRRAPD